MPHHRLTTCSATLSKRAPQPDAHAFGRSGTVIRCGQFVQGFYEEGGVPPRIMIEDAQIDARSFALAEFSTKSERTQAAARSVESEKALLNHKALHGGQRRAQKPADDRAAHIDQQQLLDLDWSSAIADGQTRPSPKPVSKKPKRKAGKGKAAVQAASSSSAGGTAPSLESHGPDQQASPERQAEHAAGLSANAPDAASPRPGSNNEQLKKPCSGVPQHVDSAAVSDAALRPAGGRGDLGADSGSRQAEVASPASAESTSAAATDLRSLSESIDSSVRLPMEASSSAAHGRTGEGLRHASASSPPQMVETSTRLSVARSSSMSANRTTSQAGTQVGAAPPDSSARDSHTVKPAAGYSRKAAHFVQTSDSCSKRLRPAGPWLSGQHPHHCAFLCSHHAPGAAFVLAASKAN